MTSPTPSEAAALADKIDNWGFGALTPAEKDLAEEFLCEALRATAQSPAMQKPHPCPLDHVAGMCIWPDCVWVCDLRAALASSPAAGTREFTEGEVIIVTARLRALNALRNDYGQLQTGKVREALRALASTPPAPSEGEKQ